MSKAFSAKLDDSIAGIADDESVCTLRAVVTLNPSRFMKKPFLHHNDAKVNDDFTSKRKQGILDDLPNPKQTLSIINIISFTPGYFNHVDGSREDGSTSSGDGGDNSGHGPISVSSAEPYVDLDIDSPNGSMSSATYHF